MQHEWSPREEILAVTHRWPTILLFGLVGILLAWIIAFAFPTTYRATKELYVGINIYQIAGDEELEIYQELNSPMWKCSDFKHPKPKNSRFFARL